MNFKLKALFVSLALIASMPASAAMSSSSSGNSSLILTVFDATGAVSGTFDLGFDKSTFVTTANNSWDLTTGNYAAAWTGFLAAATVANAQYAVFAGDSLGSGVGAQSLFTTGAGTMTSISTSTLTTALSAFDTYINANSALTSHNSVADGASFVASTGGTAYAGNGAAYGGNAGKVGGYGDDANGLVGTNLYVWNLLSGANGLAQTGTTKFSNAGFNPYFSLSSTGLLTYMAVAEVPEADTSAMMLAGIGLMGFIARRRKAV